MCSQDAGNVISEPPILKTSPDPPNSTPMPVLKYGLSVIYGGPQVSRQKQKLHGKSKNSTAKTKTSTAKTKTLRQKTKTSTAKTKTSRQKTKT